MAVEEQEDKAEAGERGQAGDEPTPAEIEAERVVELQKAYDAAHQFAVDSVALYDKRSAAPCSRCGVMTSMYFRSRTDGNPLLCICHVQPIDLDDNLWTYDRFRVIMRPLYERYEKLTNLFYRNSLGIDFRQPGAGGGGDSLTYCNGFLLHNLIQRYTNVFQTKMKASKGIRALLDVPSSPNMSSAQVAEYLRRQEERVQHVIHSMDGERPLL
jgi:hypothetical protein